MEQQTTSAKSLKKLWILFSISITLIAVIVLFWLTHKKPSPAAFDLEKTSFQELPGWDKDDQTQALMAFQKSCAVILKKNGQTPFASLPAGGSYSDWQRACQAAEKLKPLNSQTARHFFEEWFEPYAVTMQGQNQGLFTGYYLPLLHGSLTRTKRYNVPIYGIPKNLVTVDLGLFSDTLKGHKIKGEVINNRLVPYPDRSQIEAGAIHKEAPVLVWVDSKVDSFFMQVQGSGVIKLRNGKMMVLGFAQNNGHAYTAIGRKMLAAGLLDPKNVSMQSIYQWLATHPQQADGILNSNASYVFFQELPNPDPLGAQRVALTPERSLAVDNKYIPLGAPLWVTTQLPENNQSLPFQRLLIAQDTGGAIKGAIRGDIYWGEGQKAKELAGHMQNPGRYWILLARQAD